MSKFFLFVAVLVGHCFLQSEAGRLYYPYQQQPTGETDYYLPNYNVLPPQDFNEPPPGPAWQPIVEFPWPANQHEPHHPPHYHVGPKPPCHKVPPTRPTTTTTTTTKKPTTTTKKPTTTTKRPTTTTPKHHLHETLAALHKV